MKLLSIIDPKGTESRKKRRIKRRVYHSLVANTIVVCQLLLMV